MEQPCDPTSGSCRDALQDLFVYLDGQLTTERRLVIKTHIDRCSPCLDRFSFEAELREVIAQRCRDTVPESLRTKIAEAIGGEPGAGPLPCGDDDPAVT